VTASYVLALDQGTTGSTALVVDARGRIRGRAYSELTQHYPRPGWVEHDPEDIWQGSRRVMRAALRNAKVKPSQIAALGITNQRETTLLWDRKTGLPVHRAIVWQDRRTASLCQELKAAGHEPWVRERTGLVLDPYFSGSKLRWLFENVKGLRSRASSVLFGTVDSYLVFKLTGGKAHLTDYTNASRTLVFDIHKKRWDPDLLDLFHVPPSILPDVVSSSGLLATTDPAVFGARVPIAGIAGDQQAALYGQACFEPGRGKNTYGTGCFLLVFTGTETVASSRGLITTLACAENGAPAYAVEGSVFIAGAAVQWLRDGLGFFKKSAEVEALARSVDSTLGVVMVPAFVGLGAPYWDPDARGALLGLTRGVTRAHVARAALESIAYQTRDVVEATVEASGKPITELRVDGGAAANDFLLQFQADVLGVPVDRPKQVETTALGAAFLAGRGVGIWTSAKDIEALRKTDRVFTPRLSARSREALYQSWTAAVSAARTFRTQS